MGIPEDSGPTPFDCPKNSRYQVTPSLYPVRIPTDQDARAAQSSLDHCALQDSHDRCPDGDGRSGIECQGAKSRQAIADIGLRPTRGGLPLAPRLRTAATTGRRIRRAIRPHVACPWSSSPPYTKSWGASVRRPPDAAVHRAGQKRGLSARPPRLHAAACARPHSGPPSWASPPRGGARRTL